MSSAANDTGRRLKAAPPEQPALFHRRRYNDVKSGPAGGKPMRFSGLLLAATLILQASGALAADEPCPVMQKNLQLIEQAGSIGVPASAVGSRGGLILLEGSMPNVLKMTTDVSERPRDYLTDSIINVDDLLQAKQQADDLQGKGQTGLAARIRSRIEEASNEIFGQKTTQKQLECISVAEQLRQKAWNVERGNQLDLAEKMYQGVADTYEKELGDNPKTANAMGEIARVCVHEKNQEKAREMFAKALSIYAKHPGYADSDMASVLETYADFMQSLNQPAAAEKAYRQAAEVRSKIYRQS
jgi:hypothetical protein